MALTLSLLGNVDWVADFTESAAATLEKTEYRAYTGNEWVTDEMQVVVGGQIYGNSSVLDSKSRFIPASHLSM